jgi:hypothetical protein
MSFPTILGPWYVVQRRTSDDQDLEYYTSMEDGGVEFTRDEKRAMVFMSLGSAARVAEGSVATVRVLYNEDHAKEFGRD